MSTGNGLGSFLQDVIGRDEVLTPSSGRLRQIHAQIAKEVENAKNDLHSTVQQQWPTLKRQYESTIDLSDRVKSISGEVKSLEGQLDGDEAALGPRLQASFSTHGSLSKRHKESDALVELLQSLRSIQAANTAVEELLAQGRLDEVVPALQTCRRLIEEDTEEWKRDCRPYKEMKSQYAHSRIIAQERLEEALDACIAFSDARLRLSTYTLSPRDPNIPSLSLQSIIGALARITPLEKQFERIAKSILKMFVKPVLVDRNASIQIVQQSENQQTLVLRPESHFNLQSSITSLEVLLQALKASIATPEAQPEHRKLFLAFIIPPIQQMLVDEVLVRSIPSNADHTALDSFESTCETVAAFEKTLLALQDDPLDAVLQHSIHNASQHWSNALVERCFASLRASVSTSDYWNKTEQVDWLDDPTHESDDKKWESWLSFTAQQAHSVHIPGPAPQASTSQSIFLHEPEFAPAKSIPQPSTSSQEQPAKVDTGIEDEEVAWDFDENAAENEELQATEQSVDIEPRPGKVPESPDLDADDAWGLDDDELAADNASIANSPPHSKGHKRNQLSKSSTRSKASMRSTASSKGKGRHDIDAELNGEDAEDGGWSFDGDELDSDEVPKASNAFNETSPTFKESPRPKTHSRHSSEDDAWGWTRHPDSDEDKPIGKPTKVIASKRLGNKAKHGDTVSSLSDHETPSRASTSLATPRDMVDNVAAKHQLQAPPEIAVQIPSVAKEKVKTKLLISVRAKDVLTAAQEVLEASLRVSSWSSRSLDFSSSAKRLLKAFSDGFDLYRAIMPVAHHDLINTVPSIGMQFSNDCLYIAHAAVDIVTRQISTDKLESEERLAKRKPIVALRTYGYRVLDAQIDLQRTPLMETLDEADGFRNTDEPDTSAKCQRCVKQLVHTITSISHAWKPVLLKRVYYECLGILVNAVLLRVLVEIENQEDISEEASHRLNDLCKMLHDLEELFRDGEDSTIALYVPVWFKFKFLSELLEASMADIMYLFNEGHLVDFSSTELNKLIRALFADSQLRQRNLDTIARGPSSPSAQLP